MLTGRKLNVTAVLTRADGSKEVHHTHNIVTNAGDTYYAQKAVGAVPTNAFDALHLGTTVTPAPTKASDADNITAVLGSGKVKSAGYPRTADPAADNTGSGVDVVTWKFEYGTAEANATGITEGIIAIGAGALSVDEPVLTHFAFGAAFNKTTNETLVVYVNHTANGV